MRLRISVGPLDTSGWLKWTGFGGMKHLSDVEEAAGRPMHVAGGARRARASAAMAAGAGFTIASLLAVPELLLPDSMFLVESVSIAMAALSYRRVDKTCVGDLTKNS